MSAKSKAPHLAESIIVERWWENAHDTYYIRLVPGKECTLIDIRAWVTLADGIPRPGKGFSCSVTHLPRLYAAIGKAMAKVRHLGLADDEIARVAQAIRANPSKSDRAFAEELGTSRATVRLAREVAHAPPEGRPGQGLIADDEAGE
jgi:hypothetical protein